MLPSARRAPAADVVFIGDSLTEDWRSIGAEVWEARYARRGAVDFGVGGDRTDDVLWRIERGQLDGIAPRLVVLLVGTNDLGNGVSPAQTFEGIAACVRAIRARLPDARLLLLGLLPRGTGGPQTGMRRAVAAVNAALARLDDGRHLHFLDIGHAFLEADGTVRAELFELDKLHVTAAGYRAWADAMAATFDTLV